jgi:hypothetical protein
MDVDPRNPWMRRVPEVGLAAVAGARRLLTVMEGGPPCSAP